MNTVNLRGFATVSFFAADHAAARQWYTDLLGMEPYFVRPGYVEFRLGDYQHELGIIDSQFVPNMQPSKDRPAGAIIYWHVDNLEDTLATLLSKGAAQLQPPTQHGEGFITASVVDPFGNILGVMYNQHYLDTLNTIKNG